MAHLVRATLLLSLSCGRLPASRLPFDAGVERDAGTRGSGSAGGTAGGATAGGVTGGGTTGGASCSSATCANGCCAQNGTCVTDTTTARCGTGGASCRGCTAGTTCEAGVCSPCGGCVDLTTGLCRAGLEQLGCGRAGAFCQFCDSTSTCEQGDCVPRAGGGIAGGGIAGGGVAGGGSTAGGAPVFLDGGVLWLGVIGWNENAFPLRQLTPPEVEATCVPFGSTYPAWGTDLYTDDSSICTAAAHAGVITPMTGGRVRFTFAPGQATYIGSTRHNVQTSSWVHAHPRSLCFAGTCAPSNVVFDAGVISWVDTVAAWNLSANDKAEAHCPPGRPTNAVWGTAVYTADSAVCVAAVHDGRITASTGGPITVHVLPGQAGYVSTMQNGVSSSSWGSYTKSFQFVP